MSSFGIQRACAKWSVSSQLNQANINFKASNGYTPLYTILQGLHGGRNDIFGSGHSFYLEYTIKYSATFNYLYNAYAVSREWNSTRLRIAISLFNVIGQNFINEPCASGVMIDGEEERKHYLINTNDIDIICLAVMKTSDLKLIKTTPTEIIIDLSKVKVLMSESKFKDVDYMPIYYNKGIRAALVREYNRLKKDYGLVTEVVSDDVFEQYYETPYTLKVNSVHPIAEATKIVNEIKDRMFENINDYLTL